MKLVYFTHSLLSCWNHGNAHFLRGVFRELLAAGHDVSVLEPRQNWSLDNLLRDAGEGGLAAFRAAYPELRPQRYGDELDLDRVLEGADTVLVHEWNEHALVARIGRHRRAGGRYRLLFHDTHHRAVSDPASMRAYDLDGYDAVLAFGETLSDVYRRWGWGDRVFTWHEAADTRLFRPPEDDLPPRGEGGPNAAEGGPRGARPSSSPTPDPSPQAGGEKRAGLVWIGNWGDDERGAELEDYLFRPAARLGLTLDVYGVRYPDEALATLARHGARHRGWLPNAAAPGIFARHLATAHVPRRLYVDRLPGIPTIRVFEALACGIPLVSAPWRDDEGLFRVGTDFLMADDPGSMERHLAAVRDDSDLRASLVLHGLETVRARHTCGHRAAELLDIVRRLDGRPALDRVA